MGLAERQAMAQFKEGYLPEFQLKLNEAIGKPVEIAIDETSFSTVDGIRYLSTSFFDRFVTDIQAICQDKLGKEALQEAIKKVQISYTAQDKAYKMDIANGTFSCQGKWEGSLGNDCPSAGMYKEFLVPRL